MYFHPLVFPILLTTCYGYLTNRLLGPITGKLQQQTDINIVCEGAPAYLLMLDSLLVANPDGKALFLSAAKAYSGFSSSLSGCGAGENRIAAGMAAGAPFNQ